MQTPRPAPYRFFACEREVGVRRRWPTVGKTETALLLVHHRLNALSCWSIEDLYPSATTLLQIIVATEKKQRVSELYFYSGLKAAAKRKHIPKPDWDLKNMRDDRVHEGCLIGTAFKRRDKAACDKVVADALNWFDRYMHAALYLGQVPKTRFQAGDFATLNAYSI